MYYLLAHLHASISNTHDFISSSVNSAADKRPQCSA